MKELVKVNHGGCTFPVGVVDLNDLYSDACPYRFMAVGLAFIGRGPVLKYTKSHACCVSVYLFTYVCLIRRVFWNKTGELECPILSICHIEDFSLAVYPACYYSYYPPSLAMLTDFGSTYHISNRGCMNSETIEFHKYLWNHTIIYRPIKITIC